MSANTVNVKVDFRLPKDRAARRAFESAMTSLAAQVLEAAARECDGFASAAVGHTLPGGGRDPFLYEQGIGAERCAALVRGLKEGLTVDGAATEAAGEVSDGDEV